MFNIQADFTSFNDVLDGNDTLAMSLYALQVSPLISYGLSVPTSYCEFDQLRDSLDMILLWQTNVSTPNSLTLPVIDHKSISGKFDQDTLPSDYCTAVLDRIEYVLVVSSPTQGDVIYDVLEIPTHPITFGPLNPPSGFDPFPNPDPNPDPDPYPYPNSGNNDDNDWGNNGYYYGGGGGFVVIGAAAIAASNRRRRRQNQQVARVVRYTQPHVAVAAPSISTPAFSEKDSATQTGFERI